MIPARIVVAGAGVTGLSLAFTLQLEMARRGAAADITVIEAAREAGGHARTIADRGWLVEAGPNGFLDREPETMDLIREVGLEAHLVEANPAARRRFVVVNGGLCQVPESPPALIKSRALSWNSKLRLLREPFAAPPPDGVDETVFAFAERRLGREAAETLVDTAVSGISAGDSRLLSVRSQFPILPEWERRHGSLLRAVLAQRKTKRPRARLLSFDQGLGTLTRALAARLGERVRTGSGIATVAPHDGGWRVGLDDGGTIAADHVVFATPAHRTASIVRGLDADLAEGLAAIPYSGLAVVTLGYAADALGDTLDGYGYLVTRAEGLATLGVLWESSIFPGRAAGGGRLLRVFMGGARRPDVPGLDEDALLALARHELADVMGITSRPEYERVIRWPSAIAQYTVGHDQRVAAIRERLARHPGLAICGTAVDGVSFNHAIAAARRTARRLAGDILADQQALAAQDSGYPS
jgi:oxygen-dependent protoporphyrinogen oxidase